MLTRNKMASQHSFAMVPRSDIPRSRYLLAQNRKTTFNGGDLIPCYCEEILPGDHFKGEMKLFARFATPITPVLDNAELETFFFFVPNRILWDNWEDFIGGGNHLVPTILSPAGGFPVGSIYDQLGLPTAGQLDPAGLINVNALPLRAYALIFNEWFRDQNLTTGFAIVTGDGPETWSNYGLQKRAKKHDYFTSCLPWPQKGTAVSIPIGTTAPVVPIGIPTFYGLAQGPSPGHPLMTTTNTSNPGVSWLNGTNNSANDQLVWQTTGLQTDLSAATAATINALRLSFQVQRMLEKDARGGSRYIEQLQTHFGVRPPDFRLQRPEYIGGGRTMVNTHPVAQTSESNDTPQGNLAAFTTASGGGHKFSYAATEHGYIIGIANVRTDLTYQQGVRKHWLRQTRYDFYFPTFAHLGEQAVTEVEIYAQGLALPDNLVFGYQERWAEYRYTPNEICGLFRSTAANNIDVWHYAEEFVTPPVLNNAFIQDPSALSLARSMAVGEGAAGQQILMDTAFRVQATRPMPTYSVPGLIDHF